MLADKDGNVVRRLAYKAFGEEVVNSGTGEKPPYTYTGKELDASGLMYYGARYYDPALGRFITPDTVYDAGMQGLNRYSYALNNPLRYTDPSGHGVVDSFLYGGWGNRVADHILAGAERLKSFNDPMLTGGTGLVEQLSRLNVARNTTSIDVVAGVLSGFFRIGTGTGEWIADPLDYNKIPVLGPVGQNFGTSLGEFIMEPSIETGAQAVAASCQVVGTAFGTAQLARMVGIPGTKGYSSLKMDETVRTYSTGSPINTTERISLEHARKAANRNGIDMRALELTYEEGHPLTEFGFHSQTGGGTLVRAANGRYLITLTDAGLSSEQAAVNTIAHELNHIREIRHFGPKYFIMDETSANFAGDMAELFFK